MRRERTLLVNEKSFVDLLRNSRYEGGLTTPHSIQLVGTKKEIRARLRAECPAAPGVYAMVNADGEFIYVGMSKRLRNRLLTYFSSKVWGKKESRIGRRAVTLIWQPAIHELIAWLRERELIRQLRPGYNVQGHPTRMKLGYIVLGRHEAASFQLRPEIPKKHAGAWGPIPMTRYTRIAVEELNHQFQLRDCPLKTPMRFQGDEHLFDGTEASPCLRADLGTCLAPCVGQCTRRKYSIAVGKGRRFLNGESETTIAELNRAMGTAVAEQRFERAARLRDRSQALQRLDLHLRRFHDWRNQANFIYSISSSIDGSAYWIVVQRGDVLSILPRPTNSTSRQQAKQLLKSSRAQKNGRHEKPILTGPDEFEASRILFRWFRLFEDEKQNRLSYREGLKECQSRRHAKAS